MGCLALGAPSPGRVTGRRQRARGWEGGRGDGFSLSPQTRFSTASRCLTAGTPTPTPGCEDGGGGGERAQGDGRTHGHGPNAGAAGPCAQKPDTPMQACYPDRGHGGVPRGIPSWFARGGGSGLLLSIPLARWLPVGLRRGALPKNSGYPASTVQLPLKPWGQRGRASPLRKKEQSGGPEWAPGGVKAHGSCRAQHPCHRVTPSPHRAARGLQKPQAMPWNPPPVSPWHTRILHQERGEQGKGGGGTTDRGVGGEMCFTNYR